MSAGPTGSSAFAVDSTAPVLSLPSNITAEATGPTRAVESFTATATATDAVDGSVAVTCAPTSGSLFSLDQITQAIRFVSAGARFIATNPDATGPSETGIVPACGAMAALIERATGKKPYFVGKPNPLMMRRALAALGAHSEDTIMVGDRMDTDIVTGMEAGMETILVLTGVTRREEVERYPYQPTRILESVADIEVS